MDLIAQIPGYRSGRIYLASRASGVGVAPAALVNTIRAGRTALGAEILHVHGEIASAICLPLLAARTSVVTINGLHVLRRARGFGGRTARVNLRLVVRAANRTICVSESEHREVVQAVGSRLARRVALINNGVPAAHPPDPDERRAARAALGIDPALTVGLLVASLESHKDPLAAAKAAVEAAVHGADLLLLIAGDGPLRPELERLECESRGVVRLLGHISDVRAVGVAADFFVLPSVREGLSFALLDAMSWGLAPVVSDAPGNVDAVGDAGIVVRTGDVAGLAAAFERLAADPDERVALGERARERVSEAFSADETVRATRELYETLRTKR